MKSSAEIIFGIVQKGYDLKFRKDQTTGALEVTLSNQVHHIRRYFDPFDFQNVEFWWTRIEKMVEEMDEKIAEFRKNYFENMKNNPPETSETIKGWTTIHDLKQELYDEI